MKLPSIENLSDSERDALHAELVAEGAELLSSRDDLYSAICRLECYRGGPIIYDSDEYDHLCVVAALTKRALSE